MYALSERFICSCWCVNGDFERKWTNLCQWQITGKGHNTFPSVREERLHTFTTFNLKSSCCWVQPCSNWSLYLWDFLFKFKKTIHTNRLGYNNWQASQWPTLPWTSPVQTLYISRWILHIFISPYTFIVPYTLLKTPTYFWCTLYTLNAPGYL